MKIQYAKTDIQRHITNWEQSGLSQSAYCRQAEVNIKTFGNWRRNLHKTNQNSHIAKSEQRSFIPVSLAQTNGVLPVTKPTPKILEFCIADFSSLFA